MVDILQIEEIVSDSTIRNGAPIIAGTSIRVMDIVLSHTTGDQLAPAAIAHSFKLNMGQVYAALAYYHLNQAAIDQQINDAQNESEQLIQSLSNQGRLIHFE